MKNALLDQEAARISAGPGAQHCQTATVPIGATTVDYHDELFIPFHKRLVKEYVAGDTGGSELHLYYGEKEIVFDEADLFGFGEGLAQHDCFTAGTATTWSQGLDWLRVRDLLEDLIAEGIVQRRRDEIADTGAKGACPSRLPAAQSIRARTWLECEAIMQELTGQPLERGYLELLMPIYRIAHIALDTEGRQVGEANVFPGQLRLDIPTEWRSCPHAGSRYQDQFPMNVTALKSMRVHWRQVLVAVARIREAFVRRYPHVENGWTVGDLERLSSLVLTLPAWQLMREQGRVENGQVHPVLSSMYRVTDGVRLTMHNMLFVPVNEPTLSPEAPMDSATLYAYVERNALFLSDYGVCAGPKALIDEFLSVMVDGNTPEWTESVTLDGEVESALGDVERAFDYGLYGLQAHAVVFSYWSLMANTYEQLWQLLAPWSQAPRPGLADFITRVDHTVRFVRDRSYIATEEARASRDRVFENMFSYCARGLKENSPVSTLHEAFTSATGSLDGAASEALREILYQRCGQRLDSIIPAINALVGVLGNYFCQEQALLRTGCEVQSRINRLLGRTAAIRPFTASDLHLYYRLQASHQRPPNLEKDLEESLGLGVTITRYAIDIVDQRVPV
jgi:hypothetical protein